MRLHASAARCPSTTSRRSVYAIVPRRPIMSKHGCVKLTKVRPTAFCRARDRQCFSAARQVSSVSSKTIMLIALYVLSPVQRRMHGSPNTDRLTSEKASTVDMVLTSDNTHSSRGVEERAQHQQQQQQQHRHFDISVANAGGRFAAADSQQRHCAGVGDRPRVH
jgi:hypothetical protein